MAIVSFLPDELAIPTLGKMKVTMDYCKPILDNLLERMAYDAENAMNVLSTWLLKYGRTIGTLPAASHIQFNSIENRNGQPGHYGLPVPQTYGNPFRGLYPLLPPLVTDNLHLKPAALIQQQAEQQAQQLAQQQAQQLAQQQQQAQLQAQHQHQALKQAATQQMAAPQRAQAEQWATMQATALQAQATVTAKDDIHFLLAGWGHLVTNIISGGSLAAKQRSRDTSARLYFWRGFLSPMGSQTAKRKTHHGGGRGGGGWPMK
jgi:hypothetical protein